MKYIHEQPPAPIYKLAEQGTSIFITGAPLAGKSTIAPHIASAIEGLTTQPMDIFRLLAQSIENEKPASDRNKFVEVGSCDAFEIIGDGKYSKAKLIKGFNLYSEAVSALLADVIPQQIDAQGVQSILFEGVQLTPNIVSGYLKKNNRLIVITSTRTMLEVNRQKVFGDNIEILVRYPVDRLMFVQEEILSQIDKKDERIFVVENTSQYMFTVAKIIAFLQSTAVVVPIRTKRKNKR